MQNLGGGITNQLQNGGVVAPLEETNFEQELQRMYGRSGQSAPMMNAIPYEQWKRNKLQSILGS
jgi:hypothetical protein